MYRALISQMKYIEGKRQERRGSWIAKKRGICHALVCTFDVQNKCLHSTATSVPPPMPQATTRAPCNNSSTSIRNSCMRPLDPLHQLLAAISPQHHQPYPLWHLLQALHQALFLLSPLCSIPHSASSSSRSNSKQSRCRKACKPSSPSAEWSLGYEALFMLRFIC